jgi:hypothetical protein
MSLLSALAGTAVSLAALGYLASSDPKRRRAFRLPAPERRYAGAAWAAALAPGAFVAAIGGAGSVFVWLGATSILGWGIAALPPGRAVVLRESLRSRFAPAHAAIAHWWRRVRAAGAVVGGHTAAGLAFRGDPKSIAALETRVRRLEEDVAALRRSSSAHRRATGSRRSSAGPRRLAARRGPGRLD